MRVSDLEPNYSVGLGFKPRLYAAQPPKASAYRVKPPGQYIKLNTSECYKNI